MSRDSSLRASDADREAVTERLRTAAAEGRLEPDELEERLHTTLRARTYGELDLVLADLPGTEHRGVELMPAAQAAVTLATRVVLTLVVLTPDARPGRADGDVVGAPARARLCGRAPRPAAPADRA